MSLKERIKQKGISYSALSAMTDTPRSTLNEIVNDRYNGKEETKKKVIALIELILANKEDLNLIMYKEHKLMHKVFFNALKSRSFNTKESEAILKVINIFEKYEAGLPKNNKKQMETGQHS